MAAGLLLWLARRSVQLHPGLCNSTPVCGTPPRSVQLHPGQSADADIATDNCKRLLKKVFFVIVTLLLFLLHSFFWRFCLNAVGLGNGYALLFTIFFAVMKEISLASCICEPLVLTLE